jgi:hypothetical protein
LALVVILLFVLSLAANAIQIVTTSGMPRWTANAVTIVLGLVLLAAIIGWVAERAPYIRLLRDTIFKDRDFSKLHALRAVVECEWLRATLDVERHRLFDLVRLRIEYALLSGATEGFDDVARKWVMSERDPGDGEKRPIVDLSNWFTLASDDNRKAVENYFTRLDEHFPRDKRPAKYLSLCEITIPNVYIAPISLLRGLLAQFEQDWGPAIDNFERTLRERGDWLKRRDVQMFIFDCWLLWGPSVQICSCPPWQTRHAEQPFVFGQVGFGDENNSMYMYIRRDRLQGIATIRARESMSVSKVDLTARLLWSRFFSEGGGELPDAQRAVVKQPRLLLQYEGHRAARPEVPARIEPAYYYSAYLWIAFIILPDGELPKDHRTHPWKSLLTFFEHGNIADKETFRFLQHQLAIKTARGLVALAREEAHLKFAYVCAFDDSGCGYEPLQAFAPPKAMTLVHDYLKQLGEADVWSRTAIPCHCVDAPDAPAKCVSWFTVSDPVREALPYYDACHLHETTEEFFTEIRRTADIGRQAG